MKKHTDTFFSLSDSGKIIPPYKQTYSCETPKLCEYLTFLESCNRGQLISLNNDKGEQIPGHLRPQDAMKLYELAYHSKGDILELGCSKGLSTFIITKAILHSNPKKIITTVDIEQSCVNRTIHNINTIDEVINNNTNILETIVNDGTQAVSNLINSGRKYSFVFVDHSHEHKHVLEVCKKLGDIIDPGGFCLFHDYNDARNNNEKEKGYGVYSAVHDGLDENIFEFYGCYGCTGLFRKKTQ